jgi:hypothetical protein
MEPLLFPQHTKNQGETLEQRLERGELITFSPCPFALPTEKERACLFDQRLQANKKNISYNPQTDTVTGFAGTNGDQEKQLTSILKTFALSAQTWLKKTLPGYARAWRFDRASFRPEEEATRKLRLTARNDLLHIDAFPSRPTLGYRILRLYVNIHPTEPRVWVTSDTFDKLLAQYGSAIGLPNMFSEGWAWRFGQGLLNVFQPGSNRRTIYDRFMLRFHHFLKSHDQFQERSARRFWHFAPGTAWLAFTDSVSHADLRGRFALEHSFFIAPQSLELPNLAPAALLERACGIPVLTRAA